MTKTTFTNRNKVMTLASLFALAVLTPGSALAMAGGTDRPVKGSGSGTLTVNLETGVATGDATGVSSLLGKIDVHFEGILTATGEEGTLVGSATVIIVAANGDQLTGNAVVTSTVTDTGRRTTVEIEITSGTGRFANATGTVTVICLSGEASQVGQMLVSEIECEATGRLTF